MKLKPRIRKFGRIWICRGYQPYLDGRHYSFGISPKESYDNWLACRRPK